ncbi:peptidoglycan DD-metalloendopeptidase family protein [Jeotgalibacillus sp. JSM ZJ347]|uniref:peptidoglycan DD-metalloendopeptidase family protein n=1 Tax=Jeotgalibacillus sp. JSM ZJ347 TaxID=3342117 RepID=UPI0035A88B17
MKNNDQKRSFIYSGKSLKIFAAGVMLSTALWGFDTEASAESRGLTVVHHVYAGEAYVGVVTDPDDLTAWAEKKEEELEEEASGDVKHNLTLIPEHVFNPQTEDQKLLEQAKEAAQFVTDAYELKLGDHSVAYVDNEEAAKETIRQLQLTAVSEEELDRFEKEDLSKELESGDSRIIDIQLKGMGEQEEAQVDPGKISEPEEAVEQLLAGTTVTVDHEVAEGETKEDILERYGMSEETFDELNPKAGELSEGMMVKAEEKVSGVQVQVKKESRVKETIDFKEEVKESDEILKGEIRVEQEGQKGEKAYTLKQTEVNGKQTAMSTENEQVTKDAKSHIVLEGTKEIPSKGTGSLQWPADGGYISSHQGPRWGDHHKGIDIASPDSLTLSTADNGVVVSAGFEGDYGNKVVIDHNNGMRTIYAHLSEIHVQPGQTVAKGETIGLMGTTGFSTGIHLHFEVYVNGELKNPMDYLNY